MTKLITVHSGPLWEVQLLQGRLDEERIPSFLPDASTKRVDPFITGANPLDVQLQVREGDVARARPFIEDYVAKTRAPRNARPEDALDPDAPEDRLEAQAKLGRRIRWASLLVVTAPIGLVLGLLYLKRLEPGAGRPAHHALNLAAIALSLGLTLGLLAWVASLLP